MAGLAAILLAGGSGARLGAGRPKALVTLAGQPMVRWSASALVATPGVERLIVVTPRIGSAEDWRRALGDLAAGCEFVRGGARRRDSVRAGLEAAGTSGTVLVHDAARPLVRPALVERVAGVAARTGAAVPAVPVPDALVRERRGAVAEEIDRSGLRAVQTPQGFDAALLARCHGEAPADWDAPDDGAVVRRCGHEVSLVPGDAENLKITWPVDLARAEALLSARNGGAAERIGIGWDVHPLVAGRPFRLAGVTVDASRGPAGHSDGDPLAHAIADALLGAAALGDIGTLFPDDDPGCAGLAGDELLRRTVARLAEAGWRPVQVDAVLVVDRPKLAPAREEIRAALARCLGLDVSRVSVKGKRTEGLGALADGAGVACHAIARIAPRSPAAPTGAEAASDRNP